MKRKYQPPGMMMISAPNRAGDPGLAVVLFVFVAVVVVYVAGIEA